MHVRQISFLNKNIWKLTTYTVVNNLKYGGKSALHMKRLDLKHTISIGYLLNPVNKLRYIVIC